MHDDRAFLDAIREHPEDDLHRLAWADWLDDHGQADRAAFIRAQLQLANLPEEDPARDALEDEADDLLAEHEAEWVGPLAGMCLGWRWRRGCVERVTVWAETLLAQSERLFALSPIRDVRLLAEAHDLARLAGCPALGRLEGLEVSSGWSDDSATPGPFHRDRALQALLVSPFLKGLRRLDLTAQGIEGPALQTLIDTGTLSRLERLDLSGNASLGDRASRLLLGARADRLQSLHLLGTNLTAAGLGQLLAAPICPALHNLVVSCKPLFRPGRRPEAVMADLVQLPLLRRNSTLVLSEVALNRPAVEVLCRADAFPRLEALHLMGCQLDPEAAALLAASAGLANLRRLDLGGNQLRDKGARALAASPHLGRLSSLGLAGNQIGGAGLRALLGSDTLAKLRCLDLSGNFVGATGAEALTAKPRRFVRLDLAQANLDAEAARLLAGSPALARLRSLDLKVNRLGDNGVEALARSTHLFRLRELCLDSNGIDSPGARALVGSPHLARVVRLGLRNAHLTSQERDQLRERFGAGTLF